MPVIMINVGDERLADFVSAACSKANWKPQVPGPLVTQKNGSKVPGPPIPNPVTAGKAAENVLIEMCNDLIKNHKVLKATQETHAAEKVIAANSNVTITVE